MKTQSIYTKLKGNHKSLRWFSYCTIAILSLIILLIILFPYIKYAYIKDLEQGWQENSREALIDGYTNFKAHYLDSDAAVYIFSYQFPPKLGVKEAFAILRRQIPTADSRYAVISESPTELVFRRPAYTYSKHEGFDEYRFLVNDQQGKVTVMFANLDSPSELKWHQSFIETFYQAHQNTEMTVTFDIEAMLVYTLSLPWRKR